MLNKIFATKRMLLHDTNFVCNNVRDKFDDDSNKYGRSKACQQVVRIWLLRKIGHVNMSTTRIQPFQQVMTIPSNSYVNTLYYWCDSFILRRWLDPKIKQG